MILVCESDDVCSLIELLSEQFSLTVDYINYDLLCQIFIFQSTLLLIAAVLKIMSLFPDVGKLFSL